MRIKPGTTSKVKRLFIYNSTDGSALTGVTHSDITAYYIREGGTAVEVSLSAGTIGTWSSGGFVEISSTNMPGIYEFGIPDSALAAGADSVVIQLKGGTNMAEVNIEMDLQIDANIISSEIASSLLGEGFAGTTWTFTNATTIEQSFTLGDITGWQKLWCGVKRSKENEDADALILIEESNPDDSINDGLQYINGAEAETKGNGSLTVSDQSAGTVTFALEAIEAKKLPTIEGVFEFKWMDANDKVHILSTRGVCNIQRAYVQDVS